MKTIPIAAVSISYSFILFMSSFSMQHITAWRAFLGYSSSDDDELVVTAMTVFLTVVITGKNSHYCINRLPNPNRYCSSVSSARNLDILYVHIVLLPSQSIVSLIVQT